MNINASLIITTYNWVEALNLVLMSVNNLSLKPLEVIIADDGSNSETKELVTRWSKKMSLPIIHVWQEDKGFRAARIRNKAALAANGNYLIYIDGDCILRPNFIKNHIKLAKKGYFVAGNRVLIDRDFSEEILDQQLDISVFKPFQYLPTSLGRRWPLFEIPLGFIRTIHRNNWKKLKGCNFAAWKDDVFLINGSDESFIGWGYEDSEMAIRLLNNGIKLLNGRFSTTVLHIWHKERDRSFQTENWAKLQHVLKSNKLTAEKGLKAMP